MLPGLQRPLYRNQRNFAFLLACLIDSFIGFDTPDQIGRAVVFFRIAMRNKDGGIDTDQYVFVVEIPAVIVIDSLLTDTQSVPTRTQNHSARFGVVLHSRRSTVGRLIPLMS